MRLNGDSIWFQCSEPKLDLARSLSEGAGVKVGSLAAADAQRILDGAARRLLAARLDGDSIGTASRDGRPPARSRR